MPVTLTHVGRTPGQGQFDLDKFTEHYKADAAADIVLTDSSVPQKGDAHPDYAFMFVTDRSVQESGPAASALDIVYVGALKDTGGDTPLPVLPPSQTEDEDSVMSASSKRTATAILTEPATIQYYAPTSNLSWITYTDKGTKDTVADPVGDPIPITVTIGDTTFDPGSLDIGLLISLLFIPQIVGTVRCRELVAGGKYWLNQGKKTKTLVPWMISLSPGFYPAAYAIGHGYVVGDTVNVAIPGHGSCDMNVTSVWSNGGILATTLGTNTLDQASSSPIPATGGSGSGASYTVIQVP